MPIDRSLLSGSTSMLLLHLLGEREMYGYEMIESLERLSQNVFSFKAGTLYPLLHALEDRELVTSEERPAQSGRMRRYYRITAKGRKALAEKKSEWATFTHAVHSVMEGGAHIAYGTGC